MQYDNWDVEHGRSHPFLKAGLPEGCYGLQKTAPLLQAKYRPTFYGEHLPGTLTKIDILCVGEQIEIKAPLLTSGGDVIIYADKLILRDRIDTRPYFERKLAYFYQTGGDGDVPGPAYSTETVKWGPMGDAYQDYYQRSFEKAEPSPLWTPELLGGFTPPANVNFPFQYPRAGISAPDDLFDKRAVTSGDILIGASEIDVKDSRSGIDEAPSPLSCDSHLNTQSVHTKYLLNASGARGARGGISNSGLVNRNYQPSNSPGSNGADAGSIHIFLIRATDPAIRKSIENTMSVNGGPQGPSERFDIPLPTQISGDTACSFTAVGHWNSASRGAENKPVLEETLPITAFIQIVNRVRKNERQNFYDLEELAKRATHDNGISAVSFENFFAARLRGFVAQAQARLITDLDSTLFPESGENASHFYVAPFLDFHANTIGEKDVGAPIADALLALKAYSFAHGDPASKVASYLGHSGGLLNSGSGQYDDTTEFHQLLEILRRSNEIQRKELTTIEQFHIDFEKYRVAVQQSTLETQLAALRAEIDEADKTSGLRGLATQLGDLRGTSKTSLDMYTGFRDQARADNSTTKLLLSGMSFYASLGPLAKSIYELGSRPNTGPAKAKIVDLQTQLDEVIKSAREEAKSLDEQLNDAMRQLMLTKVESEEQCRLRTVSFERQLRRVLILFQRTQTANRETDLKRNLYQLRQYTEGNVTEFLDPGALGERCGEPSRSWWDYVRKYHQSADCLYWSANSSTQVFFGDLVVGRRRTEIPILVIDPSSNNPSGGASPLFGFSILRREVE